MHHSSARDLEMEQKIREENEKLRDIFEQLGATGEFPGGKLTESDKGEIKFAISFQDGKVILNFGDPVAWIGMDKAQAKDLAYGILSCVEDFMS